MIEPEVFRDPEFGTVYRSQFLNEASLAGKLKHPHIVSHPRRRGAGGLGPHRDGGGGRRRPVAARQRRHAAAGRRCAADRLQVLRRARLRVQRRHRPPRHQAGEHHDRAGHRRENRRFRRRPAAQDPGGADGQHGLALLHVAGADGGRAAHASQRHVLPRRGAVRAADRATAVHADSLRSAGAEDPSTSSPRRRAACAPTLPKEIDRVVLRALGKKPEQRYATWADFALELSNVVQAGAAARTPSPTARNTSR